MKSATFMSAALCLLIGPCVPQNSSPAKQSAKQSAKAIDVMPQAVIKSKGHSRKTGELIALWSESIGEAKKWHLDVSDVNVPDGYDDTLLRQQADELRQLGATVIMPGGDETLFEVEGDRVYLASYAGVYRCSLVVAANVTRVEDGKNVTSLEIDTAHYNVTVTDDRPTPPSPPNDDDEPDPPPSEFGVAGQVEEWLSTISDPHRNLIPKVKQQLLDQAALCAKGEFRTIAEVENSLLGNLTAILSGASSWRQFGERFNESSTALENSGKIKTPADMGRFYSEVAGAM